MMANLITFAVFKMILPRVYSLLRPTLPLRTETEGNLVPTDSFPRTRLLSES